VSICSALLNREEQTPLTVSVSPMPGGEHKQCVVNSMKAADNKHHNTEDVECGVSVAESDKQEWAFTLYDFDGRGKITKEDLSDLLKSLYNVVAIRLPQTGTKTLKLRLTVSPDTTKHKHSVNLIKHKLTLAHDKPKHKVPRPTHRTSQHGFRSPTNHQCNNTNVNEQVDMLKDSKNFQHAKRNAERNSCKAAQSDVKLNNLNIVGAKLAAAGGHVANVCGDEGSVLGCALEGRLCGAALGVVQENAAEDQSGQAGIPEKRELAEMVAENMQRQHKIRRYPSDPHGRVRSRRRQCEPQTSPGECKESQERRNYYLDLAGMDSEQVSRRCTNNKSKSGEDNSGSSPTHDTSPPANSSPHNETAPVTLSHNETVPVDSAELNKTAPAELTSRNSSNAVSKYTHKHEQRQKKLDRHSLPAELLSEECLRSIEQACENNTAEGIPSPQQDQENLIPASCNVSLPAHLPASVSPHYYWRHRHRERNRKRAMQQVAEWIEREHAVTSVPTTHVIVQHNHIHEHHHHHHYHHYNET